MSKDTAPDSDPACPPVVTDTGALDPAPAAAKHLTDVSDSHKLAAAPVRPKRPRTLHATEQAPRQRPHIRPPAPPVSHTYLIPPKPAPPTLTLSVPPIA